MKNILIIVDMQNGFARNEQTRKLIKKIELLLQQRYFDIVIGTRFLNEPNSMYEKLFHWNNLETNEERLIPDKIETYMDYVCDKYIYNCCNDSFMQRLCQLNDGLLPDKVFVIGVDTDCCVLTTATGLFEHNVRPVVLSQYCNSNGGEESHKAGLLCMSRLIGKKQIYDDVITSAEMLKEI